MKQMHQYVITAYVNKELRTPVIFKSLNNATDYIESCLYNALYDYVENTYEDGSVEKLQFNACKTIQDSLNWGIKQGLIQGDSFISNKGNCEYNCSLIHIDAEPVPSLHIPEIAYELYKQDWILSNISEKEQLQTMREYYNCLQDCIKNGDEMQTFEDWIFDNGYGGSLYVCFEEFLDYEFQDKEYMKYLLDENNDLWTLYEDYIKMEFNEEIEMD